MARIKTRKQLVYYRRLRYIKLTSEGFSPDEASVGMITKIGIGTKFYAIRQRRKALLRQVRADHPDWSIGRVEDEVVEIAIKRGEYIEDYEDLS